MSSFLSNPSSDDTAVLLAALEPLWDKAPGGAASADAFLKSGADLGPIKAMLAALGLVHVAPDGSVKAVSAEDAAAAVAAAGARCTDPLVTVPVNVMKSVEAALAKQKADYLEKLKAAGGPPAVGTQCKRKNCKNRYEDESSNNVPCRYCPGEPVFHEGFKYWSCCDGKKTLDFEEFLNLPGCATEEHCLWYEEEVEGEVDKPVRIDFFESGRDFVVSFFTKCAEPSKTEIKVNADTLTVKTTFERNCVFNKSFHLKGTVVPDQCRATLMSAKIDVKLVKTSGERWDGLEAAAAPV